MRNRDKVTEKYLEENGQVYDTLDVREDIFCEEELVAVLKGWKDRKASGADSVVNQFIKYGGYKVKISYWILSIIFEKREMSSHFKENWLNSLYKKEGKSDCGNYRGISLVSVGSKILSPMLIIKKCLSYQTPLVLSFIYYE